MRWHSEMRNLGKHFKILIRDNCSHISCWDQL